MSDAAQFPYRDLKENLRGMRSEDVSSGEPLAGESLGVPQSSLPNFVPWVSEDDEENQPELLYTAEDLEKAINEARRAASADTAIATRAAMANELEQRRCDILAVIRDQLEQQRSSFDNELARYAGISQRLAIMLARAVIPRALENIPFADIADCLKASLARLASEPSIQLHLSPDLAESGQTMVAEVAKEAGFAGEVEVVADAALGLGDAEVRWQGNTIEHRLDRIYAEAADLIDQWLNEKPERLSDTVEIVPSLSTDSPLSGNALELGNEPGLQAE